MNEVRLWDESDPASVAGSAGGPDREGPRGGTEEWAGWTQRSVGWTEERARGMESASRWTAARGGRDLESARWTERNARFPLFWDGCPPVWGLSPLARYLRPLFWGPRYPARYLREFVRGLGYLARYPSPQKRGRRYPSRDLREFVRGLRYLARYPRPQKRGLRYLERGGRWNPPRKPEPPYPSEPRAGPRSARKMAFREGWAPRSSGGQPCDPSPAHPTIRRNRWPRAFRAGRHFTSFLGGDPPWPTPRIPRSATTRSARSRRTTRSTRTRGSTTRCSTSGCARSNSTSTTTRG